MLESCLCKFPLFVLFNSRFSNSISDEHLLKSCSVNLIRCITITTSKICNKIIWGLEPKNGPQRGFFTPTASQGALNMSENPSNIMFTTFDNLSDAKVSNIELFHNLSDQIYYEIQWKIQKVAQQLRFLGLLLEFRNFENRSENFRTIAKNATETTFSTNDRKPV